MKMTFLPKAVLILKNTIAFIEELEKCIQNLGGKKSFLKTHHETKNQEKILSEETIISYFYFFDIYY